ncbi:MarR family winged helix-turn-helix transcriptional regulator [Streptomyces sp. NPDC059215]|uniref:MarR family winged helix-turn-helix transcriptional regulator n=1 Tax=Streptomyces sp. NPDC059215 TaxID=3346772 RepID=UPI0036BF2503
MGDEEAIRSRWTTLNNLHHEIEERLERRLQASIGISTREFLALAYLQRSRGSTAQLLWLREVASAVSLSQSATSRLIKRLEERGLLSRVTAPHDARAVEARLNQKASILLDRGGLVFDETLREAIDILRHLPVNLQLVRYLEEDRPQ